MSKRKSAGSHKSAPKNNLRVLCKALMAAGLFSASPSFAGPLPTPCAGACSGSNPAFIQAGTFKQPQPITSGSSMTINQTSQTAILNWQSFNIDKGYSVTFKQPSSTASTLNRILDPTLSPTTIAGSLTANGQIYLINQNGIIFANGAQVNTGALIASSLDITDSLYQQGYLTNVAGIPDFTGTSGFVRVDTGAVLNGSRIMLFAPVVENSGTITTPDGQAVLAAGNNVYLEASQDPNLRGVLVEVDVTNPGASDPALAAKTLADGSTQPAQVQNNSSGTVTNAALGNILAQRGNITLVGYAVNQQGMLSATTAVNENGTIKLEARYNVAAPSDATLNTALALNAGVLKAYDIRATQTGTVTLASGSSITIAPETASTATATASQTFNPSIVEVMGNTVDMQKGSSIVAPGGNVTLAAVSNIDTSSGSLYQTITSTNTLSSFLNPNFVPNTNPAGDTARVFVDSGSTIDVSGSTATVSVARDILAVQLRGAELADSPLQKTGPLYGDTVYVDIRKGTPYANYSGEEAQIQRGVAELTSGGGSVKLISTGDVVANQGSVINISGGQIDYTGANITTTSLVASNGAVYDISNASPNINYTAISGTYTVSSTKWGITQTYNASTAGTSRWDPGYIEGKSAGSLTVLSPTAVLDGNIVAKTVAGINQTQPYVSQAATAPYINTYKMLPQGGTLVIGDSAAGLDALTSTFYNYVTNADVVFQAKPLSAGFTLTSSLTADYQNTIYLDPNLFSATSGISNVGIYTNKSIAVNSGTSLTLAAGGSLALQADTIDMYGSLTIPSGTVTLGAVMTADTLSGSLPGGITVGSAATGSTLSTRGTWVNDSSYNSAASSSDPVFINGGNVTIKSAGNLAVVAGTVIDASGGAWVDSSNNIHGGNGGSISLAGNYSLNNSFTYNGQLDSLNTGLESYGVAGGKGGTLSISESGIAGSNGDGNTYGIVIGGTTPVPNALNLGAGFFNIGGFTSYSLSSSGANLLVAPNTTVTAKNQTLILDNSALQKGSGTDVYSFSQIGALPDWQRNPVSISLKQSGGGGLKVDTGADIVVDPGASIKLSSDSQLTVLGTLDAPAGTINLTLNSPLTSFNNGESTIWLGSQSELLAQGAVVMTPNANGLLQGQVLSGGSINLNSNMFVVAQQGSLIDVSGSSATLDLPQSVSGSVVYSPTLVAGNAGKVAITATEGALLDGSMNAEVLSGSTAAAGSFSFTLAGTLPSQRHFLAGFPQSPLWEVMVASSGNAGPQPGNDSAAGKADLTAVDGLAYVDASALKKAGFDALTLASGYGPIVLADQVALTTRESITLNAPVIDVAGSASINSAYVLLANTNLQNQAITQPLAGTGTLNVTGQLVDITGDVTVSEANQLNITGSEDIRLNGVLNTQNSALVGELTTQGNMTLLANQVYPTTMSDFTLAVVDNSTNPTGTITISPGSSPSAVMSAGGQVTLSADVIAQNGVLKAPLGTINLGSLDGSTQSVTLGAGSVTSVSANGQVIPFGSMVGGTGWVYELTGSTQSGITLTAPPQKQITIQANNVDIKAATGTASAAKIDLSGGGDLYASEFIPGTGGTLNVLDPTQGSANTYAVIPGLSTFAPYDPQFSGQYAASTSKSTLSVGSTVYLSGGDGLSAGYYALLPASYALLPGAYTVTVVSGHQDMLPSQSIQVLGGSEIVAGKLAVAGTDILATRWSGFEIAPGSVARTQSQFQDNYASSYFTSLAATNGTSVPYLPADAGQLVVTANGNAATLALNGTLDSQPGTGGQGAQVDLNVVGGGFDIVSTLGVANGMVQLTTDMLNNLGTNSLLIGGVRSLTSSGMSIAVGADTVQVDNAGTTLQGPEIILAANNAVTVTAGSSIQGSGTFAGQANNISIGRNPVTNSVTDSNTGIVTTTTTPGVQGDGALLRVSSGPQVTVTRINLSGSTLPVLSVESGTAGATLGGNSNSILLDSSYATNIAGDAQLSGSAFGVSAQNIALGNPTSTQASTLLLSSTLLGQMSGFSNLVLHSYNDIDFYGAVSLGGLNTTTQAHLINSLTLDAKSINGFNNSGMSDVIDATQVTLMNNNGSVVTPAQYGGGNLTINAGKVVVSGGNMAIQGFDGVSLIASTELEGLGSGGLSIQSGDANTHTLTINAGQITAGANANQSITAPGYDISIGAGVAAPVSAALGASLAISGNSINDAGIINMPTASVSLSATGSGSTDGVTLASGSEIIASGISETLGGQTVYAPAGSVTISAATGGITLASGSTINVSANAGGGNAGSITLDASAGQVNVSGTLSGNSSATGGSFTVDAGSLAGTDNSALTALNDNLTAGGFSNLRDIRVRTGDLVISADTVVSTPRAQANTFQLEADTGNIDVQGTINSSGTNGGSILLAAGGNVTVENGALLDAHATGSSGTGGNVTLETTTGGINLMAPGNATALQIDVHGAGNTGGSVLLRAPQINGGTDLALNTDGTLNADGSVKTLSGTNINISSGADVSLEGFKVYNASNLPAADVSGANITINAADTCSTNCTDATGASIAPSVFFSDATNFANNAAAIKARLNISNDANMIVTPGVEIDSTGNLTLAATASWDLSSWRFNDGSANTITGMPAYTPGISPYTVPGILTLRAAGNLTLNASLSDGFSSATSSTLLTGPSWSYRLAAGADMSSANVIAVANAANNVVSLSNVVLGSATTLGNAKVAKGGSTVTVSSTANLVVGALISGDGFPAGTTIASITNSKTFVTSAPDANASKTAVNTTLQAGGNTVTVNSTDQLLVGDTLSGDGIPSGTTIVSIANGTTYVTSARGTNITPFSLTLQATSGNFLLAKGSESTPTRQNPIISATMNQVRTGTGFIDVAAGGNFALGNTDSVIYTAGLASTALGVPSYTYGTNQTSYFSVGGGNINITADGNIYGAYANQLVSEWLWRQGESANNATTTNTSYVAPAWWINYAAFRQNIGALGGGNVTISAGGDINNLSASVPTSGYVDSTGNMVVLGGGNLTVTAGGNINSGIFYVGNGQGTIQAGGAFGAYVYPNATNPYSLLGTNPDTILLLGQGGFDLQSGGDINLQTVLNPTMLGYSFSQKPANGKISFFYTYDGGGNISLASLGGNINLANNLTGLTSNNSTTTTFWANLPQATNVYPASLDVTAYNGGINNSTSDSILLFPSSTGNLQLFAATSISLGQGIGMSDMSPTSLLPINSAGGVANVPFVDAISHGTTIDPTTLFPVPLHANDTQPITIVAGVDIKGNENNNAILQLPKQTLISAGNDIINVSADIQNQQPADTTSFVAGRDITFTTQEIAGVTVSGPGQVVMQAGRNIDLGFSNGVVTEGNLNNPALPSQAASITVLAGAGQSGAATEAFINQYINPANAAAYINKYLDPNTTLWTVTDISNYLSPTTPAGLVRIPALIPYVASKGASAANAFNTYTALSSIKQGSFIAGLDSNSGNADLISYVANNGAPKGLTAAQAFTYFQSLTTEKQSLFITSEQALANFKALSFADQLSFITGGADSAMISYVASNGGPKGSSVTATQAFDYFKSMSVDNQIKFITGGADLITYVNSHETTQVTTWADAYTAFSAMPVALQNTFVDQVLFAQLQQSGSSAISSGNYSAGYAALATLFPSGGYSGDLTLFNSQIKTEVGGNINILTPGGGVDAGLANVNTGKLASQIGVVTVGGGDVNAFVNNDFTVNQSRVFTVQGGNILMWSSAGNIDAGNGSKTATSTPPPLLVVDPKTGEFSIDATGSIVGSGIRVLLGNPDVVPGSVGLFAPTGTINAGDAGIGSAGNIYLGALQVIGANNINFSGAGSGVPVATVAPVSVSGMSNMQDAGKAADQATQSLNNANDLSKLQEALANFKPTLISVDVIGLGDEGMGTQQ